LANAAQDNLQRALKAGCSPGVLVDGTESKPVDVYIPLWNYGKSITIDICGESSADFSINVEEPLSNAVRKEAERIPSF
jgi:hypothetical protein